MKTLRPYQQEAIDAIYSYWQKPRSGNGVVVVPTGGGKSLIIAHLAKDICTKWPGTRILILSHVKELLQQNYEELLGHWPEAPVGLYSAGLSRKDIHASVLVAGIQSLANKVTNLDPPPEIVIVDECHLIPRNDSTRYMAALKTLKSMYPHLRVVGLSATPYRLDSGWLHIGEGAIFNHIIYDIPVQRLIDESYLSPVVVRKPSITFDLSNIKHSGGEFVQYEAEKAILESGSTIAAVADMVERGKDRKKWLVFASGIKHANEIKELLDTAGVSCGIITGETGKLERDSLIEDFKGHTLSPLRCLINVNVLTTGFNVPGVDFIALMRPTESVGLYVQMVGRGLRRAPGKNDCLIADYAGLTLRHGPIDAVDPSRPPYTGEGNGVPPAKECPECMAIIHAALKICPACGHEFPPNQIYIYNKPVEAPVLKSQIEPEELEVRFTTYSIHEKEGKEPSVKVSHACGVTTVNEWIFPKAQNAHMDFIYRKFCASMGMNEPYPRDAECFVAREDLRNATKIWTTKDGKWDRVVKRQWGEVIKNYDDEVPF